MGVDKLKSRKRYAKLERQSVHYVEKIVIDSGHIFREINVEDVGVDAQIEICKNEDEPSAKLIAIQIKTGESYIKSENDSSFTYYPKTDDLQYWNDYSLPMYLIIYRKECDTAYWVDMNEFLDDYKFEDIITKIDQKKIIVKKSNIFSIDFLNYLKAKFVNTDYWYNKFLKDLFDVSTPETCTLNIKTLEALLQIDSNTSKKLCKYILSRRENVIDTLTKQNKIAPEVAIGYIDDLVCRLKAKVFDSEKTGFVLIAFLKRDCRDEALKFIEEIIPFNNYLIMHAERSIPDLLMNYYILVASDCWENGQIAANFNFDIDLKHRLQLKRGTDYEADYYHSISAASFVSPKYLHMNPFHIVCDKQNDFYLFDWLRYYSIAYYDSNESKWLSIGEDRVKIYKDWDPAIYGFFNCVLRIRDNFELTSGDLYLLECEFEITNKEDIDEFIKNVKAANSIKELPFGSGLIASISEGVKYMEQGC